MFIARLLFRPMITWLRRGRLQACLPLGIFFFTAGTLLQSSFIGELWAFGGWISTLDVTMTLNWMCDERNLNDHSCLARNSQAYYWMTLVVIFHWFFRVPICRQMLLVFSASLILQALKIGWSSGKKCWSLFRVSKRNLRKLAFLKVWFVLNREWASSYPFHVQSKDLSHTYLKLKYK